MAKKKLFGNVKEPRCETCAHGKLSANGESVLCVQGGAVPLTHSCRRYRYDPLRRVPKRRPQLGDYSASDFALSDVQTTETAVSPSEKLTETSEHSTFEHLFAYLDEHETPDADTIRAILNKTYEPEAEPEEKPETEPETEPAAEPEDISALSDEELLDRIVEEAVEAKVTLAPDNSPDIDEDLARLDMTAVPAFALTPLTELAAPAEPLIFSEGYAEDVDFITDKTDAPLSADDLLFLPEGTPSDHDGADNIGGFTPLTGNE